MFADDTNLFYESNDLDFEASDVNQDLINVKTWRSLNKRTHNVDKTNFIVSKNWQNKLYLAKQLHVNNKYSMNYRDLVSGCNH